MRLEWERTDDWCKDQDIFKAGMMIVRLRKVCISEGTEQICRSLEADHRMRDGVLGMTWQVSRGVAIPITRLSDFEVSSQRWRKQTEEHACTADMLKDMGSVS